MLFASQAVFYRLQGHTADRQTNPGRPDPNWEISVHVNAIGPAYYIKPPAFRCWIYKVNMSSGGRIKGFL